MQASQAASCITTIRDARADTSAGVFRCRRACGVLAVAATLSLTACGGNDDDEPPQTDGASITKAQFVMQADAICRASERRLAAELDEIPRPDDVSQAQFDAAAPFLDANAAAIRAEVARVATLGTPTTDADLVADYLAQRRTAASVLRSAAQAARDGNAAAFGAELERVGEARMQALAERIGFEDCPTQGSSALP